MEPTSDLSKFRNLNNDESNVEAVVPIAEELRRLLSSIRDYTNRILKEPTGTLSATQRNLLNKVQKAIENMGGQIDNLFQMTSLATGSVALMPGPIDLLHCIDETVTQARISLSKKELALRMDFPEQIPPLEGTREPVIQIVSNLITNAVGASPNGEEIILAARVQEVEGAKFLFFTVSDAGEGVPPEDLSRVFQPMGLADDPIQGLGASTEGLSIVKNLCKVLDGRVWFDSEVGIGSTFTILMPAAEPASPPSNG